MTYQLQYLGTFFYYYLFFFFFFIIIFFLFFFFFNFFFYYFFFFLLTTGMVPGQQVFVLQDEMRTVQGGRLGRYLLDVVMLRTIKNRTTEGKRGIINKFRNILMGQKTKIFRKFCIFFISIILWLVDFA